MCIYIYICSYSNTSIYTFLYIPVCPRVRLNASFDTVAELPEKCRRTNVCVYVRARARNNGIKCIMSSVEAC